MQYRQVDRQILVQGGGGGGTTQKYFSTNESWLLLIYQVKRLVAYGRLQNQLIMKYGEKFLVSNVSNMSSLFTLEIVPL